MSSCQISLFARVLKILRVFQGHRTSVSRIVRPLETSQPGKKEAARTILSNFGKLSENNKICHSLLMRYIKPITAVETEVAYGITTSAILPVIERINIGRLISGDLPLLSDSMALV
jgi:hypothetical protein